MRSKRAVLAVADVEAKHFATHIGGHDDGLGHDAVVDSGLATAGRWSARLSAVWG